jgi:hypothetical protein
VCVCVGGGGDKVFLRCVTGARESQNLQHMYNETSLFTTSATTVCVGGCKIFLRWCDWCA